MNKKILSLFIIPLVITAMYFAAQASLLLSNFGVFSIVEEVAFDFQKTFNVDRKTDELDTHLLKGEKVSGEFKASENNLGILLIKVIKFGKGSDTILFRIKKEGEEEWYYENKYWAEQFQNNQYFPFGFPPITNSKNNVYFFEIESLEGKYQNGVGVLKEKKAAAMYKYSIGQLKNFDALSSFTSKKIVYLVKKVNYWQVAAVFVLSLFLAFLVRKIKITPSSTVRFLLDFKTNFRKISKVVVNKIKSNYLLQKKKIIYFSNQMAHWFVSTKIYLYLINTNTKKRIAIGLLIFLLAFIYRFSATLANQEGVTLFYAGLGGQGDYDQFIRAATCAVTNFCSPIIHQNLLIESIILGTFYELFGFIGGIKAYLYFMLIVSSIVATLPYLLLSKKSWISVGGIIGGLFLATSDFLTQVALSFPPDNLSLFTFSIFYIVYLLTLHIGTVRWLLILGLVGLIDGMNKALFLINDLVAFVLFIPVFFYEKVREKGMPAFKEIFRKKNIKILLISLLPLLVFLTIYSVWEYFVYVKWTAYYFLGSLVQTRGVNFMSYTSFNDGSSGGNIVLQLFYLCVSAIVMIKRLTEYTNLQIIFLFPIFFGLLFFTFIPRSGIKLPVKKFILTFIFSVLLVALLTLVKNNYFEIHRIFEGEYIFANWTYDAYVKIFLFSQIIILFILNFKYSAIKLSLPIIPYIIMLIILTKNSPFPRLSVHIVVWSIILLAFMIDFLMANISKYTRRRIKVLIGPLILILFIGAYSLPKTITMIIQLDTGIVTNQKKITYLKWAGEELPQNAVLLTGGKSNLVAVGENVQRPIIYSSLYSAALLIKPNKIPGVNPTDFTIIGELQNKNNFKKKKYFILEDDIYLWRSRLNGIADGVFTADPESTSALHGKDYSIKVYNFNPILNKAIYELYLRENVSN